MSGSQRMPRVLGRIEASALGQPLHDPRHVDPACTFLWRLMERYMLIRMALSARNQLRGQIKDVTFGAVMAHIVVQVGENEVESVITRRSAEEMNLKTGDNVTVVIKSTEVMIQK